ncbi:MAG: AAA family ATPase [Candidatus Hydrogenedentes bacterium]|nr:AAA family ATPase [Candidatus Hydrogenedentota bacterium]
MSSVEKAGRLVEYLIRLSSVGAKITRSIDEARVLWFSRVPHQKGCFTLAWGHGEEDDAAEWLEVQNRPEPKLPVTPTQCREWANLSLLREKGNLPELPPEITRQSRNPDWHEGADQPEYIALTERLDEHPEVQQVWERYLEEKWLPWTEEHDAWEEVHKVYSDLFAIHQEQLRLGEEFELILGLGLLTWRTPTGQHVQRHLIVADATLEFEAQLGRFTVRPHAEGARLRPELDMLTIEEQPIRAEETAKESLNAAEDDPWERECIQEALEILVRSISSQGEYDDSLESKVIHATERPIVEYAPALILRKRSSKGLTEALKRIKEQIERGEDIPGEFGDLAEIRAKDDQEGDDRPREPSAMLDGETFFPKPSNDEQRRIVNTIQTTNGVLVQGPPGTGKSHTIANLICHLLATGQRTLITAKTPRALQVLERHVPDELRPLCINLLGNGPDERRSLESSVGGILGKYERRNKKRDKQECEELEIRVRELREEKSEVNRRLRTIRESETHTQSVAEGTYRGTAARIAEAVNRNRAKYEWFMDFAPLDKPCPISVRDLCGILMTLRKFTPEKRREMSLALLEGDLPIERFANLVENETNAIEEERRAASGSDECVVDMLIRKSDPTTIAAIRDALSDFRSTLSRLRRAPYSWMNSAVRDILGGNTRMWDEHLHVTQGVISSIEKLVSVADGTRVEFPDSADIRTLHEDACKLKGYMENGGKLGWSFFRPRAVRERLYVIKSVKIGGRPCTTVEHFSALADTLHVRIECEKAWSFWMGRSDKVHGPYTLQLTGLKSLRDGLEDALSLVGLISKCREAIRQCLPMDEPVWADESQVESVISSCRHSLACIKKRQVVGEIKCIESELSRVASKDNAHPVTSDLLKAIRDRDINGVAQSLDRIREIEERRQHLQKADAYFSNLRRQYPKFADYLKQTCDDPHWEARIEHIDDAWHWAQARYWIEDYIRQEDAAALTQRAKQIEDEINRNIAKLASLHAWSFCFSRLKEEHRRHMVAWQQSMQRLGRGTGRHAPRHRREAQQHLNECRVAVPAWVMPLHRVWDTVDPAPGIFDVIIVDEASQCGLEGLPLFYLGKKVVIVGDDKQISPEEGFINRDEVFQLMERFLYDFEHKDAFHRDASLFDQAKLRYGTRQITLREHFRCMPEIIRFSNDLCYRGTLIPLRQYGPDRLPPLEHVLVSGGYREGSDSRATNPPEADAIVQRVVEICRNSRYDGMSVGVVVLQGEAQAALIESRLLERLGAEEMERRRLICGNPYSFQGDERNIMLLSLVAASNERIGSLTRAADERRFNVAASRAQDMMILFHSVTSNDLGSSCLRRRLLEFFENTKPRHIAGISRDELEQLAFQANRTIEKPREPFESWFEVDVALELLRLGFSVVPQYEVAGKRIDLVVEGGQARLAVECDGDRWHGADRYEDDMNRQRQLERCGWEFFRVKESAFYSNKDEALKSLWRLLEERSIFPHWGDSCGPFERDKDEEESDRREREDKDSDAVEENDEEEECEGDEEEDRNDKDDDLSGRSAASGHRPEDVASSEIQDAILRILSKCSNQSCTEKSLTARVLRELRILTRGNPRLQFAKRVMRCLTVLERREVVERYRAKNKRVRLLIPHSQLKLY